MQRANALVDIDQEITKLVQGRGNFTTAWNVRARVDQIVESHGRRKEITEAGSQLVRACEVLAVVGYEYALTSDFHQKAAKRACRTFQAFTAALRELR